AEQGSRFGQAGRSTEAGRGGPDLTGRKGAAQALTSIHRALALMLVSLSAPAMSAPAPSLIMANWNREISFDPEPPECRNGHAICMRVHGIVEFTDVTNLAGPRLPSVVQAGLWYHVRTRRDAAVILAVTSDSVG